MSEYRIEDDHRPCIACGYPGDCHVDNPMFRDHVFAPDDPADIVRALAESNEPIYDGMYCVLCGGECNDDSVPGDINRCAHTPGCAFARAVAWVARNPVTR